MQGSKACPESFYVNKGYCEKTQPLASAER